MDTNRIKKFASEARNRLKAGVEAKIITLGFDRNGTVPEHMHPQLMQGGTLWNGQLQTEGFYYQWQALYNRVQQKGIKEVYEEAAYTWFNRLVAIRILMKNGLIEPVLAYVGAARTPRIVDEARMGRMPQMQERQRQLLLDLLDDDSKTTEQFAILVTAYCHDNPILFKCFGAVADYTELLLPNDILTEGGFIDMLNHTDFITDSDYETPELIGWLYQFYISERKDEVFAKKGRYNADEIAAATQIFTPNWIVKYMVQNTVGRIYLDNHPDAFGVFKPKWKYLVAPTTPTPQEVVYTYNELPDLLVGDLACGSGHILNECFDLLYDLYIYEGYSRREAIESIFTKNLRGVDLDTRAKQLATFALMLKACQKDRSFTDAHILPVVLDMPNPIPQEQVYDRLNEFLQEIPTTTLYNELAASFELIKDADSLGSIMKFELSDTTRAALQQMLNYWLNQNIIPDTVKEIIPAVSLILTLTAYYSALVMNPPYMGAGSMTETLSNYVKRNYEEGKADLFSTFMLLAVERLNTRGKYGMINMHSWMFLSSFENLRRSLLDNLHIDSLLHLGPRTFDELSGEVVQNAAFVITNSNYQRNTSLSNSGIYFRLVDGKTCNEKELMFLDAQDNHTKSIYYPNVDQSKYDNIPSLSIGGYWASDNIVITFHDNTLISRVHAVKGLDTCDNEQFTRYWYEVALENIGFNVDDISHTFTHKWYPYCKGGGSRKWYGLLNYVVNWENDGEILRNIKDDNGKIKSRPQNTRYYFKQGITWSSISSSDIALRYMDNCIFGGGGSAMFCESDENFLYVVQAFLNSKCSKYLLKILNPTLNVLVGDILNLPLIPTVPNGILEITNDSISISKSDWDAHENSWDFEKSPLLEYEAGIEENGETADLGYALGSLKEQIAHYKGIWEQKINKLHENEEELNRQFIEIYGLQDELVSDVPLNQITILQQGEISIKDNQIIWHDDVLIKQLISYAVGIWMGRYRLDRPGLNIANPNPTEEELSPYCIDGEMVYIDDDGLIPLLPQSSPFDDNLSSRIADFIRIAFGEETLTENLNYMEKALGTTIFNYVQKDFWKDHKKMYQNRPIYWLFSSNKGAFKCLAYMHRMDAYTAERVRTNYLLPYIEFLQNQINELENRAVLLSTAENRKLQNLQKDLEECREYHERLQVVAERAISFNLDDGVLANYAKFGDVLEKIK